MCPQLLADVGGNLSSWGMFSHRKYWTDNDFTKPVVRSISDAIANELGLGQALESA